jgi:signal transduction histidine kinase
VRAARLVVTLLAIGLGVVAYRVQVDNLGPFTTAGRSLAVVAVAITWVVAGAIAWSRRHPNRLGPLMMAVGFALLLRQLRYSHDAFLFTMFFWLGDVPYAMAGHVVLAYPSGRVRDKWERLLVYIGYASTLLLPLLILFFYDGAQPLHQLDPSSRPASLFLISADDGLALKLQEAFVALFYGLLAALFVALILRRLAHATRRGRGLLAPLLIAAVVAALRAVWECTFTFVHRPPAIAYHDLFWWQIVGLIAVPIALVDGLLRARLAHAGVSDLMLDLEGTSSRGFGDALARALHDKTLRVVYWLPDRGKYVDASGEAVTLPTDGRRAVTKLENDGEPVAALIHDPSLLDDPTLIRSAAAAARLSLENARLHLEARARLAQVQESRVRLVTAADEERRRIERDIHDGAQQRLVALALQLRGAQRAMRSTADVEVERLLDATVDELQVAVNELRELARGVHPAILTEDGLGAALESLATRTPFPVELEAFDDRLPAPVEAAGYFVASEGLANVSKHAQASRAIVTARRRNGTVEIVVADDGVGGARAAQGSGLRGLADRVEALGGTLRIDSPAGRGTRIAAEIPCAS